MRIVHSPMAKSIKEHSGGKSVFSSAHFYCINEGYTAAISCATAFLCHSFSVELLVSWQLSSGILFSKLLGQSWNSSVCHVFHFLVLHRWTWPELTPTLATAANNTDKGDAEVPSCPVRGELRTGTVLCLRKGTWVQVTANDDSKVLEVICRDGGSPELSPVQRTMSALSWEWPLDLNPELQWCKPYACKLSSAWFHIKLHFKSKCQPDSNFSSVPGHGCPMETLLWDIWGCEHCPLFLSIL